MSFITEKAASVVSLATTFLALCSTVEAGFSSTSSSNVAIYWGEITYSTAIKHVNTDDGVRSEFGWHGHFSATLEHILC
jgi:hypothetical protein